MGETNLKSTRNQHENCELKTCRTCKADKVCDHNKYGFEDCGNYIPLDSVEVPCRCGNCKNYNGHRYCTYHESIMLDDDFCSYGERETT